MKNLEDLQILVVDDEPDLGELVAFEFESAGSTVFTAINGNEAFDIVQNHPIDIIISDIRMPNGDGVYLLDKIKQLDYQSPKLVFMTGYADISAQEAYNKGAVAIFGKPFNRLQLIAKVQESMIPIENRWAQQDTSDNKDPFDIELVFESLEEARENKQFNVAQGGLFIAQKEKSLRKDRMIKFNIKFNSGKINSIVGSGKIRWFRNQKEHDLPKGAGVEINHIEANSIVNLCRLIREEKSISYIPKS